MVTTERRGPIIPLDTRASPPLSYEDRWYRKENRAVAKLCGNSGFAVKRKDKDVVLMDFFGIFSCRAPSDSD